MSSEAPVAADAAQKDPAELKAEQKAADVSGCGADASNGHVSDNGSGERLKAGEEPVAGPSSASPTSSPSKKDIQVVSQAMQHLAAGKRDLLIQDPNNAVASLAQCCQLLGEHYGETAPECGEAYYYYGRALLDLARMEAGVIDNVMDGVPSDDEGSVAADDSQVEDPDSCTGDEKEKVVEEVDEALRENYEELERLKAEKNGTHEAGGSDGATPKSSGNGSGDPVGKPDESENSAEDEEEENDEVGEGEETATTTNDEEEEEDEAKAKEEVLGEEKEKEKEKEDESIASDDNATTEAKDTGDAEAVEKEEEEDPSNLQLAWEMLELGKTILVKQAESLSPATDKEKEHKFNIECRISDTFQTLGELSIENENYPQAIDDLATCLKRRQKILPEDSRLIAETFYQLGVAQGFNIEFDAAVESLNRAIGVLQKRVDNLKESKESADPAKKNDAFYTRGGEVKEIESLIPEIREKIADTMDMKEETRKKLGDRRLMEEEICSAVNGRVAAAAPAANGSPKVSSISSSLIKKRKKSGDDGSQPKKPHLEGGDGPSTSNGHGEPKVVENGEPKVAENGDQ